MCLKGRQKKGAGASKESTGDSTDGWTPLRTHPEIEFTPSTPGPLMFTSEEYLPTKPLDSPITITNKSAKFAAFKVWSKCPDLFRADPPCGIIPVGGTQTVNINYQNPVKPTTEYYVRVFVALVDKEVLPEEFQAEKTATPKNYDGENFLPVQFRRSAQITPLPKEVEIIPRDKIPLNFECKPIGVEPAYSVMTITNNHPQKNLAYRVIPTGYKIFTVKWRSGVLRPGKSAHLPCMFANLKEEKETHWFLTFVVFIDSTTLPEDFRKRIAPPFVYDGARAIEITFSKSTSTEPSPLHLEYQPLFAKKAVPSAEKVASAEKTEAGGGPPSQTGAPTVTDADNPAPVPAPGTPAPAPAAPATTAA